MGLLANLIVKFSAQGQQDLKAEFDALKRKLEDMHDAGEKVGTDLKQDFRELGRELEDAKAGAEKVKTAFDKVADVAGSAFQSATTFIGGFVRAGMQGTAQADMLTFSMGQLSREVAALFLPEIELAIDKVRDLTDWFRSLDADTQRTIGGFLTWGAVLGTVVAVLPKVVAGVQALVTVTRALGIAQAFVNALQGPAGWLKIAAAMTAAAGAAYGLSKAFGGGGGAGGHMSLGMSGGQTESIRGTYDRIQAAALKDPGEVNHAEKTAENTSKIIDQNDAIIEWLANSWKTLEEIKNKKLVR